MCEDEAVIMEHLHAVVLLVCAQVLASAEFFGVLTHVIIMVIAPMMLPVERVGGFDDTKGSTGTQIFREARYMDRRWTPSLQNRLDFFDRVLFGAWGILLVDDFRHANEADNNEPVLIKLDSLDSTFMFQASQELI
jgi:hypothetical protein